MKKYIIDIDTALGIGFEIEDAEEFDKIEVTIYDGGKYVIYGNRSTNSNMIDEGWNLFIDEEELKEFEVE